MGRPARTGGTSDEEGQQAGERLPPAAARLRRTALASCWVIVPAFGEASVIASVVRSLAAIVQHVVVVDDGSRDATASEAGRAGATVLRHAVNRGQGAALQTGIDYCLRRGAEYLVTFDGDGQHSASDIPLLLEALQKEECDVVLGSRFLGTVDSVPPGRRLLLRVAVLWTRLTSGLPITDTHNGLRALTRRAASAIHLHLDGMAHASELLDQISRLGLRYVEVAVTIRYTAYSRSKGQAAIGAVRILFDHIVGRLFG